MARINKINVGGTNYDIAHEGVLKNSGFEVVSSLPTTNLFEGREVIYQGKKYLYFSGWKELTGGGGGNTTLGVLKNSGFEVVTSLPTTDLFEGREVIYQGKKYIYSTFRRSWVVAFDEKKEPLYNVMVSRGLYEILGYDISTDNNNVNRSYLNNYINYCNYTNDYLIEVSPDKETFTEIDRTNNAYRIFNSTNSEGFFVANYKAVRLTIGYERQSPNVNILSFYINHRFLKVNKIKIDHQLRSDLSWQDFGEVDFTAQNTKGSAVYFALDMLSMPLSVYGTICKIRFTIEFDALSTTNSWIYNVFLIAVGSKYLAGINNYFNLSYKLLDCYSTVDYPITLNYDVANIEPTQTGEVEKKANWVIRYLLQGVNWLKAKKLDKRAYNQVYTNCGYTNIVSSTTGALIIELPFAPTNDTNNSLTYIELNVYSHRKGCSKYIIGVYSYAVSSQYEWSVYSYMGYNYFSSIAQARRTDNNNIVIVLGEFTDIHEYEHFSISHIVTGYRRNNDDTDQFLIYTDSTSSNYTTLKDSSYIPQVISYNDLTDRPTLATVATSGDYNDLLNRPTFSGSYNDLTDKPTLFSGSYDDLTNKPNLATVATSGSYNDLTDTPTLAPVATSGDYNDLLNRPAFSGSYNDLTDKPTLATVATSGSYNDLLNKPTLAAVATSGSYDDLLNRPDLVFSNIGGNVATAQITDGSITNAKLANSSMTLNGITVNLGDTANVPWYLDYNEVDYPARIRDHWLQIYRNGVWANLMYLGDILPTQVGQITSLDNLDWYNEQVSEYEVDSATTTSILNGTTLPATVLMNCLAEQLTLNLYPISGKQYGKGSLDSLISDLKNKEFSVFVENDLDAIIGSGSDYLVRIKISKVPTVKAIIECYVSR